LQVRIPFNKPCHTGNEDKYVLDVLKKDRMSGGGEYSKRCEEWFEKTTGTKRAMLVPSGTHALEMAAILLDIQPGDEVIMPSFTFTSTANAFALRGARIKFVDIRPDTMNIDEELVEQAITDKTKAICVVHYAGVGCEMDTIIGIAKRHGLYVIEDAAQGMMAKYKGKHLGTMGEIGCYSFHETKNYTSGGEGGAVLINDEKFIERAEIIREKGTNRARFFRGLVDKYTWVDIGSSFLMNELSAAYLWGQLEVAEEINKKRLFLWNRYYEGLKELEESGYIDLPKVPSECEHNGHIFYIKVKDIEERTKLINYLKERGIMATFHYIPLHSAPAGQRFGEFVGEDRFTTRESERLLRLPMFYSLGFFEQEEIISAIREFYAEIRGD